MPFEAKGMYGNGRRVGGYARLHAAEHRGFSSLLGDLRDGHLAFGEFAARTMRHWERLAAHVARRWDLPCWFGEEDLRQEILLGAWEHVALFDPARGKTLEKYVTWNATDRAKKAGHRARLGRHKNTGADSARSRYDRAATSLLRDGEDDERAGAVLDRGAEWGGQHEAVELAHALRVPEGAPLRERLSLRALLVERDVDLAAALVYGDPGSRLACRLGCEAEAVSMVWQSVGAARERALDAAV